MKSIKEMSFDLDFVEHPDTHYFIEFPSGPLAIGTEPVKETNIMDFETGRLLLLSPTEGKLLEFNQIKEKLVNKNKHL